jgi:hypothetical protein
MDYVSFIHQTSFKKIEKYSYFINAFYGSRNIKELEPLKRK